ncbi:toll-like receptor 4 [Pecten maximus]|uniref:toll-like receptor 4 n=1 Tax=Pecten maximus TaxID=6579 RepID=UPI0014589BC4|nr:toll-like receptor 4 [Pecten maximus]
MINVTIAKDNNLQVVDASHSYKSPSCSYGLIKGLVHLVELDMSDIDCSNPNPRMLAECPNLSRLTARQCNLGKVLATNSSLFKGLYNLSFVDVSLNNLNSLKNNLFEDQKYSLKYLVLAGNNMDQIPYQMLKDLAVLERIDLSNNAISTLKKSEYHVLDELNSKSGNFQIVLSGNPLVCGCKYLDFISWIETTQLIYKKHDLLCLNPEGSYMKIDEFLKSFDEFKDSCVSQFWLITSAILTLIFFVFGVLTREAWRRSVWLRLMCRQPLEHSTFTNDIYICYCNEDSKWIKNTFAPWLDENGIEFCCEDKSFPPGLDIADNIMNAIDCSRKTVFVVSCNFLKHVYTTFTLRLTNEYSYRDGRENMNLIILLDDIKRSEFPKLVRKNWDVIRPLRWPNESNTTAYGKLTNAKDLFWKRLLKRIRRGNGQLSPQVAESTFISL